MKYILIVVFAMLMLGCGSNCTPIVDMNADTEETNKWCIPEDIPGDFS